MDAQARYENYQKLEKIGEGTYGIVYKAQDKSTNTICAIKSIRFQHEDEGIPSTAIREISLLKTLKHKNVVQLREIIYKDEKLFLIFDYLERDLKKYLKQVRGPLPVHLVKSYMRQMMEGVAHCHRNRILHRDLKPHNLLIDDHDNLQLADFGLARTYTLPIREYTHAVITLWYRAPEILLGQKVYSTPVDIWSAACIFAETIEGFPLLSGDSEIDQIFKIFNLRGTPTEATWPGINSLPDFKKTFPKFKVKNMAEICPHATADQVDLLEKMLQLDPDKRLTADEVLDHPYFK